MKKLSTILLSIVLIFSMVACSPVLDKAEEPSSTQTEARTKSTTVPTTVPTTAATTAPATVLTTKPTTAPTTRPTTAPTTTPTTAPTAKPTTTLTSSDATESSSSEKTDIENYHGHVYTGGESSKKYHYEEKCAGKYSHEITWGEVEERNLGPCGTCVLK